MRRAESPVGRVNQVKGTARTREFLAAGQKGLLLALVEESGEMRIIRIFLSEQTVVDATPIDIKALLACTKQGL